MEAVGQLTGGVAHDFNNLLTVVLGNLELVKDRVRGDELAPKFIDSAIRATRQGADLTQRLLAFSRKQALNPEVIDVNELIPQWSQLLGRTIGEEVEISPVLNSDLPPVLVDRNQLENALLNIALNSRDAMQAGGRISIEGSLVEVDQDWPEAGTELEPGHYIMLAITDTGHGMASDVVAHAFEPFYTTKEVGQGSGLGLSMVYGFARQSGGDASIQSEVDKGTTVKLFLPLAEANIEGSESESDRQLAMPTGHETVFVVEDDPDVRAFVVAAVKALGYQVFEASDGPSAIAALEHLPQLDLLLSDVVLPGGMNGRDVAECVQKRFPGAKLLFMSGYPRDAIVHQGRLDEDVALLTKPYTRTELAQTLRRVLDA